MDLNIILELKLKLMDGFKNNKELKIQLQIDE